MGTSPEPPGESKGNLDGLAFRFKESMSGHAAGSGVAGELRFDVEIRIDDLGRFLRLPEHEARLEGAVTFAPLGRNLPIRDGRFNLFSTDPRTGLRRMVYQFLFTGGDGQSYCLHGYKEIRDDAGLDVVEDMTRLFTNVYRGEAPGALVYIAGQLRFQLADAPNMVASMRVEGARDWIQQAAAFAAFTSFAYGALRDEYLKDLRPFYDTRYDNLVLSGRLHDQAGADLPFFLVAGVHDKGFPWGDTEIFWDVLLVAGERRYAITDRVLEGLHLDLPAGLCRYRGPLFRLDQGYSASFSGMRRRAPGLVECRVDFEIRFQTRAYDTVPFPFPLLPERLRHLSSEAGQAIRKALPGETALGIHITPHTVTVQSGTLRVEGEQPWTVDAARTSGECEHGAFRNVKEPTLLYHYLCAPDPDSRSARVEIESRTLRDERQYWAKDQFDRLLGFAVSRAACAQIRMEGGRLSVEGLPPAGKAVALRRIGTPLIEVNNDHFPTAVFQRRVVPVQDPEGRSLLALEEDMSLLRLEAVNSTRSVTVASIHGGDKLAALDRVLDETGFDSLVRAKQQAAGRTPAEFPVAIKPNFMFAYDKRDISTYTDPELVHHLVRRLRSLGFEKIRVVEAQSTYGEFFDKRGVREMAEYLGYDGSAGYEIVDMTEDARERRDLGPHLGMHPVSEAWRGACFRVSFAKNKTHAYAYYSLTLKNIYGALPLANKFKEYHMGRDIYHTTMEYLAAFPVDFALVDAWSSADGPFGVFADPAPNMTHTVIGGADLVAVDWVAAGKMGIDPCISPYMRLAVERFGKPEIRFIGDGNPYRPWVNVPPVLTVLTHKGMDADYHFGNLLYSVSAQMDETHFTHKSQSAPIRWLREMTVPLRRTFFVRTGENPSAANRAVSWLLYRLGF